MSFFGRCCCLLLLEQSKKKMMTRCRWRGNAIPMRWKSEYRQQQRWLSNYTGRLLPMMIWHKSLWVEASWIGYHTTIYRRRKHLLSRGAPSRAACNLCCALNTSQLLEESTHANPSSCWMRSLPDRSGQMKSLLPLFPLLGVLGISIFLREKSKIHPN